MNSNYYDKELVDKNTKNLGLICLSTAGVPAVTSNQSMIWNTLRLMDITDSKPYGVLFDV